MSRQHTYTIRSAYTIGSGTTDGATILLSYYYFAKQLVITAPATLPETITVQVSEDGGSTWAPLDIGSGDVTIAAGVELTIENHGWTAIRLVSGGATAADRTFIVKGVEEL